MSHISGITGHVGPGSVHINRETGAVRISSMFTVLRLGTGRGVDIPSSGVILGPNPNELIEVMRPQDGGVSGQVLKVIHYDGHKQVQHLKHREQEMGGAPTRMEKFPRFHGSLMFSPTAARARSTYD